MKSAENCFLRSLTIQRKESFRNFPALSVWHSHFSAHPLTVMRKHGKSREKSVRPREVLEGNRDKQI